MERAAAAGTRRGRGERAGLNVAAIVKAARALLPGELTMQAVANSLGVDRKALSNHVADRDDLLERVAADAVSSHLSMIGIGRETHWQAVCADYARGLAAAVTEIGSLSRYFRFDTPHPALLAPAERVLGCLIGEGFDDETAARALSMLTSLSIGYAQNRMAARQAEATPLSTRLRQSFAAAAEDDRSFSHIERITDSSIRTYDEEQLEMMIDIFVHGLEKRKGYRLEDADSD